MLLDNNYDYLPFTDEEIKVQESEIIVPGYLAIKW